MNPAPINQLQPNTKANMQKVIDHMLYEFGAIRTGKASPALVENIMVDAYGSQMRIKDLAGISSPDARTLQIQPWDQSVVHAIEKAIQTSNIGINPVSDGKVLRLPIPELSEERRKKLVKDIKDIAEKTRVAIRGIRRDANELAKTANKNHEITEDELKEHQDKIQKLTDDFIAKTDKEVTNKEKELMTV